MLPFIFLISLAFLVIASLTSKLQNDSTNLLIAIYSALGPAESAAIALTTTVFILDDRPQIIIKILLIAALSIIFLVNLMGYIIQTPYLLSDRKFLKWANRRMRKDQSRGNLIWFHAISLMSLFTSYKLKMVLFSRLFNFECFKFQLQDVSKFKVFNVLSFIGYFPEILSLYCCISAMAYSPLTLEQLLIFIDLLAIVALNMVFSLIIIKKDESFFHENNGGMPMNKVFNLVEELSSSTHIIGRRGRQSRQKGRTQLDDIPQYDQFAYTSTKRDRSPNKKISQKQKIKEEDSYYFEENDSEVTGSKIHSEISNQEIPQEVGNAAAPDEQLPSQRKNNQNILNIDDYYEDESANGVQNLQEHILNKPIYKQQPLSLELDEGRLPDDVIEAQHFASNLIRTRQDTTTADIQYANNTHTKVSEYLMSFQQNQQHTLNNQYESKPMDMIENQYESQEGSENNEGKFVALINESALIDSEPSCYPNILTPNLQEHHRQTVLGKEQQQAAKKIVQRVVSAHHSPKKAIITQDQPKELRNNYLSQSIALNQNHDERPIKNKSIEKVKKQQSHPINPPIVSHPIYGQKGSRSQEDDQSDLGVSIGKRSKITIKQPTTQSYQDQQALPGQLRILQGQESEPDVPRPKFYLQFIHQHEQANPSFKRSHPHSLALFSKNKTKNNSTTIDESIGESIPRQPVQALFPTTSQKEDPRNQSSFVLRRNFDRAVKFSSKPRQRPMTSKSGRFGKYSLDKKTTRGLQGKKMLSLEKIYLQRLTNF